MLTTTEEIREPVSPQVPALATERHTLAQRVETLQIVDAPTFEEAGALLGLVNTYRRRVSEVFDPIVTAAHAAHKTATTQRALLLDPATALRDTLSRRMAAYDEEQKRLAREAEEAARREKERLERLEAERVAAEQAARVRDEEEHRLAEAVAMAERGDTVAAERLLEAPVVIDPVMPRPVFVPPPSVAPPAKIAGVSFTTTWKAEVVDLMALVKAIAAGQQPITYVAAALPVLNAVARAQKEHLRIPGVRAVAERGATDKRR